MEVRRLAVAVSPLLSEGARAAGAAAAAAADAAPG